MVPVHSATAVWNTDVTSADFRERLIMSVLGLIHEQKFFVFWTKRADAFFFLVVVVAAFFLSSLWVGIISIRWRWRLDTFPTSKVMLYEWAKKITMSSLENLDWELGSTWLFLPFGPSISQKVEINRNWKICTQCCNWKKIANPEGLAARLC